VIRLIAGFIVAVGWLPLVQLLQPGITWPGALLFLIAMIPFAVLAAPLVYFMRHRISPFLCVAFGMLFGLLGAVVFMWGTSPLAAPLGQLSFRVAWYGAIGSISGALFWLAGVYRNDRLTIGSSDRGAASSLGQRESR
jgi:hypothetical protein